MNTFSAKSHEVKREWKVIDAQGKTLGRMATDIARILQGKHKPIYTPHADTGDYVVVINAEKVVATGSKEQDKKYYRHTGYPGGIKERTLSEMRDQFPERVIELAIKRMLPKGPLGRDMYRKLKVYAGPEHPHQAQVAGSEKQAQQDS